MAARDYTRDGDGVRAVQSQSGDFPSVRVIVDGSLVFDFPNRETADDFIASYGPGAVLADDAASAPQPSMVEFPSDDECERLRRQAEAALATLFPPKPERKPTRAPSRGELVLTGPDAAIMQPSVPEFRFDPRWLAIDDGPDDEAEDDDTGEDDPTPEEIRERCHEIQSEWSTTERRRRMLGYNGGIARATVRKVVAK